MGDRCYMDVIIHPNDYQLAKHWLEDQVYGDWPEQISGLLDGPEPCHRDELWLQDGAVFVSISEANYALADSMESMANAGVRFIAYNTPALEYGSGIQFGTGNPKRFYGDVPCDHERYPVAPINEHGSVQAQWRDHYRKLMRNLTRLEKEFKRLKEEDACDA